MSHCSAKFNTTNFKISSIYSLFKLYFSLTFPLIHKYSSCLLVFKRKTTTVHKHAQLWRVTAISTYTTIFLFFLLLKNSEKACAWMKNVKTHTTKVSVAAQHEISSFCVRANYCLIFFKKYFDSLFFYCCVFLSIFYFLKCSNGFSQFKYVCGVVAFFIWRKRRKKKRLIHSAVSSVVQMPWWKSVRMHEIVICRWDTGQYQLRVQFYTVAEWKWWGATKFKKKW